MNFDEALASTKSIGGAPPRIPAILEELDDDTRARVVAALSDPSITAARVAKALKKIGHSCGEGSVKTWRDKNGIT